jgi:hypothetical protein
MRLPNFHTLDVRVERRIARVTINNRPINLMDATLLGELDQLAAWLATRGHHRGLRHPGERGRMTPGSRRLSSV